MAKEENFQTVPKRDRLDNSDPIYAPNTSEFQVENWKKISPYNQPSNTSGHNLSVHSPTRSAQDFYITNKAGGKQTEGGRGWHRKNRPQKPKGLGVFHVQNDVQKFAFCMRPKKLSFCL